MHLLSVCRNHVIRKILVKGLLVKILIIWNSLSWFLNLLRISPVLKSSWKEEKLSSLVRVFETSSILYHLIFLVFDLVWLCSNEFMQITNKKSLFRCFKSGSHCYPSYGIHTPKTSYCDGIPGTYAYAFSVALSQPSGKNQSCPWTDIFVVFISKWNSYCWSLVSAQATGFIRCSKRRQKSQSSICKQAKFKALETELWKEKGVSLTF